MDWRRLLAVDSVVQIVDLVEILLAAAVVAIADVGMKGRHQGKLGMEQRKLVDIAVGTSFVAVVDLNKNYDIENILGEK